MAARRDSRRGRRRRGRGVRLHRGEALRGDCDARRPAGGAVRPDAARDRRPARHEPAHRRGDLQALVGTADPTVRHGSEAVAPASAAWPHPWRWTIFGTLIGLGTGALLALLLAAAARRREPPEYDPGMPERIVAGLEQRLEERIEALAQEQERLAAREASLAVRERDVTEKLEELRAAIADREGETRPAEREHP